MEFDRSRRTDEYYASQTERIRQELHDSGIPIVALSDSTKPAEERFGGLEQADDTITSVRIVYEGAQPDGPWASVDTARWACTSVDSGPLRWTVEHHMRRRGDRLSAEQWTEGDATVIVDGRSVAGRIVRAGSRWWAVRCARGDIEISVVARDWHPDAIAVDTLVDVVPMLSRLRTPPASPMRPEPEPVPDGLSREPHRALVDVVLRSAREQAEWRADGGPVPELPRYWTALWQAAVQRQMTLADQPEPEANRAVGSIVTQLSNLRHNAAWFREDSRLRERAIAETLLYGTGVSDDVSSSPAQHAWHSRQAMAPPANGAEVEAGAAADRRWIDAWAAWADGHAEA
jgi:hypothetical protein